MTEVEAEPRGGGGGVDLAAFFALAIGLTWLLDAPIALAYHRGEAPGPVAVLGAALSAFGPTIAAVAVAAGLSRGRGAVRAVFGPWRTRPALVVAALFAPMALHVAAAAITTAAGGHPDAFFHPPAAPEHVAALVVFSIGEEFGWRGFAQPRAIARFGPVAGPALLGVGWALWHAMMCVSPVDGSYDLRQAATLLLELPLWSIVYAAWMARANGSLAVALALHAGGHLDNVSRMADPATQAVSEALLVAFAGFAAAWLARGRR